MTLDYPTKVCDNCATPAPTTQQQGHYIDYGWSFNWLHFGHYGGFTDCLPDKDEDSDSGRYFAHLCHDCCVKMLEALPGLAALVFPEGGGGHPNINEKGNADDGTQTPPCCRYAWTWVKTLGPDGKTQYDTYFGTPDLKWKKVF